VQSGTGRLVEAVAKSGPDGQIRFEPGDVLFSKLRPYLAKSALVAEPSHGTGELLAMTSNPLLLDPRYLLYLTLSRTWIDLAVLTSYGTKMPRTSWEAMSNHLVPVTDVTEQRRIADFLDDQTTRIDQIIALRRDQMALIEAAIRSEADRHFVREPRVPLRYLLTEARVGIVVRPSDYYTDAESGVPSLRGVDVRPFEVSNVDLVKITPEGDALNTRSKLRVDDVVLVRTGDAGAASRVPLWAAGYNAIDLVILRGGPSASPAYLEFVMNAARWGAHVDAAAAGSIQQHFGVNSALALRVPFLDANQQLRVAADFAAFRNSALEAQRALTDSIALLREFKRSLISAAVSGEFDVSTASGRGVPA
jgi:type I restriction enzyme S subunit